MPACTMLVDEHGARCGRRSNVEEVSVMGSKPGQEFRIPEIRWACDRCRGEEEVKAPRVVLAGVLSRPRCGSCLTMPAGPSGLCDGCRSIMSHHVRNNPNRLPRPGSAARAAIKAVRPEVVQGYKHGMIIMRMHIVLNGGA